MDQPKLRCPYSDCLREATELVWPLVFWLIHSNARLYACSWHHELYSPPVMTSDEP